jgi:ABC-type nitrate/sulfonate/bicarbonate transport system substrate-binding protein
MSRFWTVAVLLAMLTVAATAQAADKIVLQLQGPPSFEFAGYYAALWQGFYRDAGLDVAIKPGIGQDGTPIDPVRAVTEGQARFGTGTAELVVRAGQGLPLSLLAPIFQHSGAMIYYRADRDFASPGSLGKAKLGRLPAGNTLEIEAATALKAEGLDPDKVDSLPIVSSQTLDALAGGKVDAAPGSAWEVPYLAAQRGIALKSIDPANYRVAFYGDTLFTLRRFVERDPQTVRAFRAASLKGWDYALKHPDDVIKRLLADLPHPPGIKDPAGFAHYQADLARKLADWPQIALGHSNPERWARIEASIADAGALVQTVDSDRFVYDPDAAARNRTDLRFAAILGATLVVSVALLVWLWRRGRRRKAAPGAAAAQPAWEAPAEAAAASRRQPPPDLPETDLNALLTRLERSLRQQVPRPVGFRLSLLPELWRCRAEPRVVRRMISDLVAAAAAGLGAEGAELIVGTRNIAFDAAAAAEVPGAEPGKWTRITVRDNGAGLSDGALARVFDPAQTSCPAAASAARAMREAGGFARVESAEGIGTAIHLYFPGLAATGESRPAEAAE